MRKTLVSILIAEIDRQMSTRMPAFKLSTANKVLGPGRLFVSPSPSPAFFLLFNISEKRDAFTVEIAWSTSGQFPDFSWNAMPRDWPELEVLRADVGPLEFRFRLVKLYEKPKYDPWWEFFPRIGASKTAELSVVADQRFDDKAKCLELVADAMGKIDKFALPYLKEIRGMRV